MFGVVMSEVVKKYYSKIYTDNENVTKVNFKVLQ